MYIYKLKLEKVKIKKLIISLFFSFRVDNSGFWYFQKDMQIIKKNSIKNKNKYRRYISIVRIQIHDKINT
jgi:hypothetical protein